MGDNKVSSSDAVRAMYDRTADGYSQMMDEEIGNPVYAEMLGRLADNIASLPGPVVDTACGSGHMLAMYHERFDPGRSLVGIDLSPRMVAIASERLAGVAEMIAGDMQRLDSVASGSAAAVVNFFALHHLAADGLVACLAEWHRVLCTNGVLVLAIWEGEGALDYGDSSDLLAVKYGAAELQQRLVSSGFNVISNVVKLEEELMMNAAYIECTKE